MLLARMGPGQAESSLREVSDALLWLSATVRLRAPASFYFQKVYIRGDLCYNGLRLERGH